MNVSDRTIQQDSRSISKEVNRLKDYEQKTVEYYYRCTNEGREKQKKTFQTRTKFKRKKTRERERVRERNSQNPELVNLS